MREKYQIGQRFIQEFLPILRKIQTNFLFNSIFANEATDKGLIFIIYKELIQININKTTQSKNGRRPKQTFPQEDIQMANRHRKRCSTLLIIREMQIKKMRFHLVPFRMAIIKKKSTNNKCCRWCGEKGTFLHCWQTCKLMQPLGQIAWKFLENEKQSYQMIL